MPRVFTALERKFLITALVSSRFPMYSKDVYFKGPYNFIVKVLLFTMFASPQISLLYGKQNNVEQHNRIQGATMQENAVKIF
jgi:hypothetical protein